jgi:hypothetical protein
MPGNLKEFGVVVANDYGLEPAERPAGSYIRKTRRNVDQTALNGRLQAVSRLEFGRYIHREY